MVEELQRAKRVVLDYYDALDSAAGDTEALAAVISAHTTDDYHWRGMHPFGEQTGATAVAEQFWGPTRRAFSPIQRRPDIFLAGHNTFSPEEIWVCQMGHLLGLFDEPWLHIPPTRKMLFLRYAEFHRVLPTNGNLTGGNTNGGSATNGKIAETALFTDVISVMRQAGHNPLPPQTGSSHIQPGPRTHDGLLYEAQDPAEGQETLDLIDRMISDLMVANEDDNTGGSRRMNPEVLATSWVPDMIWSGPEGIGATYTIGRYQQQHQYPFRMHLSNKVFNGHVTRIGEGNYGCFFGWANLTLTSDGGFMGLTGSGVPADMRVTDVYRRSGDKLAENWVFIDLAHWLNMQGLDVLARMRQLTGQREL